MKKFFCIALVFTALIELSFADKNRFYENGNVIDGVYVNSEDGLKVRDYPSLKSNRICGLTHKMRLQVVAVGKEETIDGITDPWVEILIPNVNWKNRNVPEYAWVFGGYLSKERPDDRMKFRSLKEKKDYLVQQNFYWANYPFFVKLYSNGRFESFVEASPKTGKGTWTLDEDDNFTLKNDGSSYSSKYKITKYDYGFFEAKEYIQDKTFDAVFGLRIDWDVHSNPGLIYRPEMYYLYDRENLFVADYNYYRSNFEKLTMSGIQPKENTYNSYVKDSYRRYKNYWDPIKAEHQKRAEEMK